jgi:hypothetical protein
MIFGGSEFGTTFFGYIPYLLISLLLLKIILSRLKKFSKLLRLDKFDFYLIVFYVSFFLFLNFFPNTFNFDQYYSAPRIFRYLAPISFPMTLHLAKLILDFNKITFKFNRAASKYAIILLFVAMIAVNIYQADEATKPGRIYRQALLSTVRDIKSQPAPQVVSESWLTFFLREVYLKGWDNRVVTVPNYTFDDAKKYENWLKEIEPTLPNGTMLITGLGNYIYYGCQNCGFHLKLFSGGLDTSWRLFREYNILTYLYKPEPARLWIWNNQTKV